MAELFVDDILKGIQGTKVKAAILKCATDAPGVTPGVEKLLKRPHEKSSFNFVVDLHRNTV